MATLFDKEAVFQKEISDKLEEIRQICSIHSIPFFFTFCVKNTEEASTYISDGVIPGASNIVLTDDHIHKHIAVSLGCDTVPHREEMEMIMDGQSLFDEEEFDEDEFFFGSSDELPNENKD